MFEALLAEPKLGQPVIEHHQVGCVDVHGEGRDQVADLLDLAGDTIGVWGA
jgi:hypothetical protein